MARGVRAGHITATQGVREQYEEHVNRIDAMRACHQTKSEVRQVSAGVVKRVRT